MSSNPPHLARWLALAQEHGTPLLVVDHAIIRDSIAKFRRLFPRVEIFYAIKANPEPTICQTVYEAGGRFDVASWEEFDIIWQIVKDHPDPATFIRDRLIFANTIKHPRALERLNQFEPLMTFDNPWELEKIKKYCPRARLIVRVAVPDRRSIVELSSKFGINPRATPGLVKQAVDMGFPVEGLSYHVGSQCNNLENFTRAMELAANIFKRLQGPNYKAPLQTLDIGGGFPVIYDDKSLPIEQIAEVLNPKLEELFPPDIRVIAEPGRFLVAMAVTSISQIIGKALRKKRYFYYIDDGVYNTFSGKIYDHQLFSFGCFQPGSPLYPSAVVGPTCDALDKISVTEELPELTIGDYLYSENVGAYTNASASRFNGFPLAKIVHINR